MFKKDSIEPLPTSSMLVKRNSTELLNASDRLRRASTVLTSLERMEDYRKVVMLNSFQFRVLRKLRHLTGLPVYYVIEIEEYGKWWYRVVDVTSECCIRKLGSGHARDTYACIGVEDSVLMNEAEFRS